MNHKFFFEFSLPARTLKQKEHARNLFYTKLLFNRFLLRKNPFIHKMDKSRKKKTLAQAALEYLMTYGWALILLVTTASFLYFAGIGGFSRNSCQVNLAFLCQGVYTQGDTVFLRLENGTARRIVINPYDGIKFDNKQGYSTVNYGGKEYRFEDVTIPSGQTFEVQGKGMALTKTASITYTETDTGYQKTANISLTTDTLPKTEISNDGIDNDGDGATDCADPKVANPSCDYIGTATALTPSSGYVSTAANVISFGQVIPAGSITALSGSWLITQQRFYFYATNLVSSPTARINALGMPPSPPQAITEGWNVFTASSGGFTYDPDSGDVIPNVSIYTTTAGQSFTISSAKMPKTTVTLQ
jgi:hypothetical protein